MISSYLLVALAIILTGFSQILLKTGTKLNKSNKFLDSYLNIPALTAYFFYILVTILYTYAMIDLPLKVVYTFGSLNYLIILIFSGLILKEPITKIKSIAAILITVGVIIFNL
jgi:multidrug transporter EmrE-like cation transporter